MKGKINGKSKKNIQLFIDRERHTEIERERERERERDSTNIELLCRS